MANDINRNDKNYMGDFANIYAVNKKFPTGGKEGQFVVIDGWAHYWNADRGTWCVNEKRDSYWDELITGLSKKIDELVITTERIVDGAITSIKLAYGAVTSDKIADDAVTTGKLSNESVTQEKIAKGAVGTAEIADGSVTTPKLANEAVTKDKLAYGAVTSDKIADDVWETMQEKYHVDALTNPEIDALTDGSFDGGKIDLCGCKEIPDDYVSALP